MNKLFIFSMALMLSLALGYGVAIPQSALAALSQGYYSNSYSNSYDNSYKKEFKPYECRKGPFEGFFTSSVEFCIKATR